MQFRKSYPERHCLFCGALLVRGLNQPAGNFKIQKFCNLKCCGLYRQKSNSTQSALCRRAQIYKKHHCEKCEATNALVAHHIDGDQSNNIESNIATLCKVCHNRLHRLQGDIKPMPAGHCRLCGGPKVRKGLCPRHYARMKKTGSPLLVNKRVANNANGNYAYTLVRGT